MTVEVPEVVAAVAKAGRVPASKLEELYRSVGGEDHAFAQRIVEMGLLQEAHVYRLLAESLGLEFENPDVTQLDAVVLAALPEDMVRRYSAIPLRVENDLLVVAMENPMDLLAIDAIQDEVGKALLPVMCPPETLRQGIERRMRSGRGIEALLANLDLDSMNQSAFASPQRLKEIAGDDAIVQLVDHLVEQAIARRVSDIHIEPEREQLRVRYRIDGRLETVQVLPKTLHAGIVSRVKILAVLDISERRKPQDGRFRIELSTGRPVEFRVSTLPAVHGEKAVLRVLDKSNVQLDLERQGLSARPAMELRAAASAPNGLVLVTGPTGSGKTTTLYGVLASLNHEDRNLITVEDPVEYELSGVTQVQVDVKAERTFAGTLRSILRQDPDVIMVGEIRDKETAEIAVHAALTGHMVLSTLHTNSALGTLTRLVDMGVPGYLLGPTIRAVVAQRLVRKLCGACAQPTEPTEHLLQEFGLVSMPAGANFMMPGGCSACRGRGFVGRVPVHEVLVWTPELASLLARGADETQLAEVAYEQGFVSMLRDGAAKAATGATTLEEVLAAVRV